MGPMKFEKAPNGSWVRKGKIKATHAQTPLGVEEEVEIREMEGGMGP